MSILSLKFAIFLAVSLLVYYISPLAKRWIVLLAASLAFYCLMSWKSIPLLILMIVQTYLCARYIGRINAYIKTTLKQIEDRAARKVEKNYVG